MLLLIDQSYSMSEPWDAGASKGDQLAMAVNRVLSSAVLQCSKGNDQLFDYFEVSVLGYGLDTGPVLHGTTPSRPQELARTTARLDTRKVPLIDPGLLDHTIAGEGRARPAIPSSMRRSRRSPLHPMWTR